MLASRLGDPSSASEPPVGLRDRLTSLSLTFFLSLMLSPSGSCLSEALLQAPLYPSPG